MKNLMEVRKTNLREARKTSLTKKEESHHTEEKVMLLKTWEVKKCLKRRAMRRARNLREERAASQRRAKNQRRVKIRRARKEARKIKRVTMTKINRCRLLRRLLRVGILKLGQL